MLKAAIEKNWLSEEVIFESLLSFKRAGADCILTYAQKNSKKSIFLICVTPGFKML